MFLSLDQLTIKDLKYVKKAVWGARTKWMDIGLELDIIKTDLDAINAEYRGEIEKCFMEMLSLWLKQIDPPPTWLAMVAALKDPIIGFGDIAEQVECNYIHVHQISSETLDTIDSSPATGSRGEHYNRCQLRLWYDIIKNA